MYKNVSIQRESWSGLAIAIRFTRGHRAHVYRHWTQASFSRVYRLIEQRLLTKDAADFRRARGALHIEGIDAVEEIRKLRGG